MKHGGLSSSSSRSRVGLALGLGLWLAASVEPALAADPPTVAVAQVKGPRRAAPLKFATGLRAGLRASGATVLEVGPAHPKKKGFMAEAKEAEADYLVMVQLRYARRRRFATAWLYDLESGELIERVKKRYRRASAAGKVGSSVGEDLGKVAREAFAKRRPKPVAPVVSAPPPPPPPPPKASAPAEAPKASASAGAGLSLGDKEDSVFRLSVGVGAQLASAYTVAVGGQVTGLAYTLNPLFSTTVNGTLLAPSIGIGAEVWFSFSPVTYQVDVSPPVDPREPSGSFVDVGGAVSYRITLTELGETGALYLTPLLGARYGSMTVDGQGDNTVVVSYSNIDVQGGLRFGVAVTEDLVFDAEGRFGGVLVYDEGPTTTGESGSGYNLRFGGGVRYWINDLFGVFGGVAYSYQRVGLSGLGTRVTFEEDPQLLDASVYSGDFKLYTGVHVGL